MTIHRIAALVATLAQVDPATCGRGEVADAVASVLRVRAWLDSLEGRLAVRAADLAAADRGDPAVAVLTGGGLRSERDAEAVVARGDVCEQMPELDEALASGAVATRPPPRSRASSTTAMRHRRRRSPEATSSRAANALNR